MQILSFWTRTLWFRRRWWPGASFTAGARTSRRAEGQGCSESRGAEGQGSRRARQSYETLKNDKSSMTKAEGQASPVLFVICRWSFTICHFPRDSDFCRDPAAPAPPPACASAPLPPFPSVPRSFTQRARRITKKVWFGLCCPVSPRVFRVSVVRKRSKFYARITGVDGSRAGS